MSGDDPEVIWRAMDDGCRHAFSRLVRLSHRIDSGSGVYVPDDIDPEITIEHVSGLRALGLVGLGSHGYITMTNKGAMLAAFWWTGRGTDWDGPDCD